MLQSIGVSFGLAIRKRYKTPSFCKTRQAPDSEPLLASQPQANSHRYDKELSPKENLSVKVI